ncbi:MAG TPA: WD40 repeat domain-containing protein [Leptolyngbyaceae cyanobacterium]
MNKAIRSNFQGDNSLPLATKDEFSKNLLAMDWTTLLKSQQADFVKRLKKQKALELSILNSDLRDCHSEMMVIWGQQLEKILEFCQEEAEQIGQKPPQTPPDYNLWLNFSDQFQNEAYEYLLRERLVDAIMSTRLGKIVKKVKIDPHLNIELDNEGNLRNESKFSYILADDSTVSIQVHICDKESFNSIKKDKIRWSVTQEDIKNHKVLIFICSFWLACCTARGTEIETILAGFLPTKEILFSSPKTYLKPSDLFYAGGLRCYLESLNPANYPPQESVIVASQSKNTPAENFLNTAIGGWKCLYTLTGHPTGINCLDVTKNPAHTDVLLASGSRGEIRLWDIKNGRLISTLSEYPWMENRQVDEINSLAFSPDGQTLISGGVDSTIKIWHVGAKDIIDILEDRKGVVRCVAFSPTGQTFATGGDDRKINLWNRLKREAFSSLSWGDSVPHSLAFNYNGKLLASGSYRKIKVWRMDDGKESHSPKAKLIHTITAHSHIVSAVAFSFGSPTTVNREIEGKSSSQTELTEILVSGSRDRTIKVWHLETGKLIRTLTGHTGAIFSVAVSKDGKTIASGSEDKTIKLWHLETGELLSTFTGHGEAVNAVVFTPDGRTLASASLDKTIKIWQQYSAR